MSLILSIKKFDFKFLNSVIHLPNTIVVAFFLSPAKDDWSNLSALQNIPLKYENLDLIVTNEWCCGFQKRLFFISWIPQWLIAHVDKYAPRLLMILLAVVLYAIGFLLANIIFRVTKDKYLSLILGLASSTSSISVIVGGIGNNLFFTLPIVFILLLIITFMNTTDETPSYIFTIKVLVLLVLIQFSGELTFLVGYAVCISFFLKIKKLNYIRPVLFSMSASLAVFFYYNLIVSGPTPKFEFYNLLELPRYIVSIFKQQFIMLNFFGRGYPDFPSGNSYLIIIYILQFITLSIYLVRLSNANPKLKSDSINSIDLLKFSPVFLALLLPLIYGLITGLRPGPELRYHLPFFIIFLGFFVAKFLGLVQNIFSIKIASILVCALLILSAYAATSSRMHQSNFDNKLWKKIASKNIDKIKVVVTFNPNTNYPLPPYYSLAESDFHADWGIGGYLKWNYAYAPEVFKDFYCNLDNYKTCVGEYYYGGEKEFSSEILRSTVFIYSDYEINTKTLEIENIFVTTKYDEYRLHVDNKCRVSLCR